MTCSEILKSAATRLKSWFRTSNDFSKVDYWLLFIVISLVLFGLIMVYSSSFIFAQEKTQDGYAFIRKQSFFAAIGFVVLYITARIPYWRWLKYSYPLLGISMGLLLATKIPGMGFKAGGASRWVRLGFLNFQPAELAKIAVLVFVARQLTLKQDRLDRFSSGVLANFLVPLPALLLLMWQPDFGSTVIISLSIFALMFLAGVPLRFLLGTLGVVGAAGVTLVATSPYRMARVMAFIDPWKDPSGKGFQILQSFIGLHQGRVMGVGFGNGKEKLFFLPEAHNDFIFSVIGEELGFIGVVFVVLCFVVLIYRGLKAGYSSLTRTQNPFGLYLAAGIVFVLGFQAFTNMAVVLGLLPTKGLALPFISYGGSAILVDLFAVGILLNISTHTGEASYSK